MPAESVGWLYPSLMARDARSVAAFGSYTWDACLELVEAIPAALKAGQPGTVEFRRALRDALEATKNLEVTNGAVTMSKSDHLGLDSRARFALGTQKGTMAAAEPKFDLLAGPLASATVGPVAFFATGGPSVLKVTNGTATGVAALGGVGSVF